MVLLTLAMAAAAYAKAALGPLQETMRGALALSDNQIALLQGAALALPMLLLAVPFGILVDRRKRIRLVAVLVLLMLAGNLLTASASDFVVLFAARGLTGLAVFALLTTVLSLIPDLYGPAQLGRANMVLIIGQYAGVSAAFALGGALVTHAEQGQDAWRWAMLWLSAPFVAVLLLMFLLREPRRMGRAMQGKSIRESFAEFWQHRAMVLLIIGGSLLPVLAIGAIMIWTAPMLARNFTLSPDRVGAIMAVVVPLSGLAGTVLGGSLADLCQRKGGPRTTVSIVGGLALLCAPAGAFAIMPTITLACTLLFLLSAILIAICVMLTALAAIVIPNEIHGLFFGVSTGAGEIFGVALAPLLVSMLSGVLGGPTMIGKALTIVCVAASLLCGAIFGVTRRHFPVTMP